MRQTKLHNRHSDTGENLPPGPGYAYTLKKSRRSFKVYQALCDNNMQALADEVLAKMRRPNVTKDALWKSLMAFRRHAPQRHDSPSYRKALAKLRIDWKVWEKFPPRRMRDSVPRIARPAGSPGLPYITTQRGQSTFAILKGRLRKFEGYWSRVGDLLAVDSLPDCAAFGRNYIVPAGDEDLRVNWIYPLDAIVEEGRYAFPLIDKLSSGKIGHRTGYGLEIMKGCMAWLDENINKLNEGNESRVKILMVHYKGFESTLPAWLIRDVFRIIAEKLDLTDGGEQDEEKTLRRFKRLVNYFINTPVQVCDGNRMQKHHGVPSGSLFANVVRTACNGIIIDTLLADVLGVEEHFLVTFGAHSVIVLPPEAAVDVSALAKRASAIFGVEIDAQRTFWTTEPREVQFLRYSNYYGSPMRVDDKELIAQLLYPRSGNDRWINCVKRAISCLMASARPIMSSQVQFACLAVLQCARQHGLNLDAALHEVRKSPQMKHHFQTLGYDNMDYVCPDIFVYPTIAKSSVQCAKIQNNIDPVAETRKMRELVPQYEYVACRDDE